MELWECPHCRTYVMPSPQGICPQCQQNMNDPPALRPLLAEPAAVPSRRGNMPIGAVCPSCGGTEFTTVRPDRFVSFAYDRICLRCRLRYAPPTPLWGSVTFIVFGFLLGGASSLSIFFGLLRAGESAPSPSMVIEVLLAAMGIAAAVYGFRSIARGG
jgi:hypothetical protein